MNSPQTTPNAADKTPSIGQGTGLGDRPSVDEPIRILPIEVEKLNFDRRNPRLAEFSQDATSETEILKTLWETMDIQELVQSIVASGFFPHEALIATEENGNLVVTEGNRRLAAVKVLLSPAIAKENNWNVPALPEEAKDKLRKLPVIIQSRKDSWRYLGFKHVNGPVKWGSYAKAAYIAEVHNDFGVSLAAIADQIGDRHGTVQRLYRGLMVLEQAEKAKVYNRENRFKDKLSFSHLYTGLNYEGISDFLHIARQEDETAEPVPPTRLKQLGEFLVWLYGDRTAKPPRPPLVRSQNPDLRQLNAAVANRESIAALRAGVDLSQAFEISRPPAMVFEESLLAAKRELTTAKGALTTGYDQSEALLRIAGSTANLAADIYDEMERKSQPQDKRRVRRAEA